MLLRRWLAVAGQLLLQLLAQCLGLAAGDVEVGSARSALAFDQFLGFGKALRQLAHFGGHGAFVAGDVEAVTGIDVEGRVGEGLFEFVLDDFLVGALQFPRGFRYVVTETLHGAQHLFLQAGEVGGQLCLLAGQLPFFLQLHAAAVGVFAAFAFGHGLGHGVLQHLFLALLFAQHALGLVSHVAEGGLQVGELVGGDLVAGALELALRFFRGAL